MPIIDNKIRNIIVISDLHCGCKFGLCPDEVTLDEGQVVNSSVFQKEVYKKWLEFWNKWVPSVTKNEDYVIVGNGDIIDGVHHGSTTQITGNIKDQRKIAVEVMTPIINKDHCKGFYMIRGTEVHVGKSGEDEESVAEVLNALPNESGQHSRWELKLKFGERDQIVHFSHHIGVTSSQGYESTALLKEYIESCTEAGRWNEKPPSIIVRSHRHRSMKVEIPSENGLSIVIATPGWQLKTPYVYRLALGRVGLPQIGGILIRDGRMDGLYTRSKVWRIQTTKIESI